MLKVIVNGYNSSNFLRKCLESIKNQTFKNYECIIVNDASTEIEFETYAKEYSEFMYVKNETNLGPLASRVIGINNIRCSDNDIIFLIDGDDWLIHENVFQYIIDVYEKNDVLLTWGYWKPIDTSGKQKNRENTLDEVYIPRMKYIDDNRKAILKKNSYRNVSFSFSHPRTFKYKLWKKIDQNDFLDKHGNMYRSATDYAFMYPMIEMCNDRFKIIYDRLVYYNLHDNNIVQKSKKDHIQNRIWGNEIKNKKKYTPLINSSFINNIVDKVFVISLDRDIYKYNILKQKLIELQIKHERFVGIDGNRVIDDFNRDKKLMRGKCLGYKPEKYGLYRSYGAYGNLLSSIKLLRNAIKYNYKSILILEDDVYFHKDFNVINEEIINNIKKNDIVWIGANQSNWTHVKLCNNSYKPNMNTFGGYGVIIKKRLFNKVLDLLEKKNAPFDLILNSIALNDKVNSLVIYPNLLIPDVFYSSTGMGSRNNIEFYKCRNINPELYDLSINFKKE